MVYRYYQNWGKYRGAAGSMIRFYLPRSDLTDTGDMSPASVMAWTACDQAFRNLSGTERDIVRAYYSETYDKEKQKPDPMTRVAETYCIEISEVKKIIDRTIRMVVVNRGLADE